jgi:hypothetical protein
LQYITACPCSVANELYLFRIVILTLCLDWITVLLVRMGKLYKGCAEQAIQADLISGSIRTGIVPTLSAIFEDE